MVKFLKDINVDNIYYFDSRTENDKITADSIISGLEWMKSNDVKYVNISLSSKKKSEELSNWISDNKDTISVYASYNNLTQSFDYPAMYDDVINLIIFSDTI